MPYTVPKPKRLLFVVISMGKQHQTFPGEPEEMPDKKDQLEIKQPNDPKEPVSPQENPDEIPVELPPANSPGESDGTVING